MVLGKIHLKNIIDDLYYTNKVESLYNTFVCNIYIMISFSLIGVLSIVHLISLLISAISVIVLYRSYKSNHNALVKYFMWFFFFVFVWMAVYFITLLTTAGSLTQTKGWELATSHGFFLIGLYVPALPSISGEPFRLGLDLQGGIHLVYEADLSDINSFERDSAMQGLRDVIERRVNLFGVTEPLVQTQGDGDVRRLIVELAGVFDPAKAIDLIGQTPFLEFRELQEVAVQEAVGHDDEAVEEVGVEEEVSLEFVATALTGRFLERADLEFGQFNEPIISLQFDKEGAEIFEELTARNLQRPIAIYLDGEEIQTAVVQSVISGGRAQITGDFSLEEAQQVVRDLNAGALPVHIELISQNSVGPALGTVSLQQSLKAGIAGLVLVMVFMILFYRALGVLASLALVFYIVFVLAILKLILVTFTLAGIAGLILSVGMAVDANILIFSRMREELKEGKSFGVAVQEGFRRAWPSIRDGNITTLLVAAILFWFGTSFVRGFALTLSIGILLSMLSAVFVTKTLLWSFVETRLEKISWLWA